MADLGLQSGTVKLVPYNPKWVSLYDAEAQSLWQALNIPINTIQHVGSTSIPGMIAKPILDIAILVDSLDIEEDWLKPLEKIGYWYKGTEVDLPDRRFFAKGPRSNRTVYIHVVNQKEYDSLIKFRDTLRSNPDFVREYSELKENLAKAHSEDRDTYTRSKKDFIKRALNQ
jgi:GrpB-like predicted nucleotidyltransferase (UPF0157 family)